MGVRPYIDVKKCKKHFTCVSVCPVTVFDKVSDKDYPKIARPADCIGCHACEANCPENAIIVSETAPSWVKEEKKTAPKKK
ncbi:4Fe-4S dicluster domain protein [Candidatus Tiddalikarchaeum anstoanum]|nr:4Fe-4S dicluster domain protein [Candidatus Tiddalikarchaeum anstoanum]